MLALLACWVRVALADVPAGAPVVVEVEDGKLGWQTISSQVQHDLTLSLSADGTGGTTRILPLELSAGEQQATLTPSSESVDLKPGGVARVRLSGSLPAQGTWKGTLALDWGQDHALIPVEVQRVAPAAPPTLEVRAPSRLIWSPWAAPLSFEVRVAEPGKRPVSLSGLRLTRLISSEDAANTSASLPLAPCWRGPGVEEGCAPPDPNHPALLPSGADVSWSATLPLPGQAGTYTGTVEARTLEGDAIPPATFTVQVRHPWLATVVTAALGVGISGFLRGWTRSGRKEADLAVRVGRLADALRALPDGDPIRLRLELQLEVLRGSETPLEQREKTLAELEAQLQRYREIHRVLELERGLGALIADPRAREALRARIQALGRGALAPRALEADAAGKNALVDEAAAIYADLRAASRPAPAPAADQEGPMGSTPTTRGPVSDDGSFALPDLPFGHPPSGSEAEASRWRRRREVLVMGIVLALAAVFAVQELWLKSATWGSFSDYVAALIWGFGLHQVGFRVGKAGLEKLGEG